MKENNELVPANEPKPTIILSIAAKWAKRLGPKLELGLSRQAACRLNGIDPEELEVACAEHPQVRAAVERSEALAEEGLVLLANQAARTDGKLALDLLSRRHSSWAKTGQAVQRHEHEHTLAKGGLSLLADLQRERKERDKAIAKGKVVDVEVVPPKTLPQGEGV